MCVVSVFTSCVQSDMYEMYDEDGCFIPRGKKSKDFGGGFSNVEFLYPYSSFPLLYQSTFYEFECQAQAYKNEKGCSNAEARVAIILQQYSAVDICSYNIYFYSVITANPDSNIPTGQNLYDALNQDGSEEWTTLGVQPAIDYIYDKGRNSFLNRKPILVARHQGTNFGHVATVTNVDILRTNGVIKYTFYVTDQFGSSNYTVLTHYNTNTAGVYDFSGFVLTK